MTNSVVMTNFRPIPDGMTNPAEDLKNFFKGHICINSENNKDMLDPSRFEVIPVFQTAFYDLGFDPDFCPDGNCFYKTQPSTQPSLGFFQLLIKMIRHAMQNPEKKAFQELVQIEKNWQKAAQAKGMLYPGSGLEDMGDGLENMKKVFWESKAAFICESREHAFFKQLSKIASKSTKKGYSSELLQPLHKFNRPQNPSCQNKENILKGGVQNDDVARLDTWGFALLGNHTKEHFIEHSSFLKAINKPGNKLKHTVRELRIAIRQENYEVFNEELDKFELHWNDYITSHDLLKELSFVYSQKNFFKARYAALEKVYKKMQNPRIYHSKNFLEDISKKFNEINSLEQNSNKLYKVFASKFPNSPTAKFWKTRTIQRVSLFLK